MRITYAVLAILIVGMVGSCTKEPTNPFDPPEVPDETPSDSSLIDSTSIAGLHALIFSPTCANSGCHDGTFEPDFRTINSTYNNLVYQPVIKNDAQGSFTYRVLPGQPDASQLIARLTYDIDGNSGIMPLVVEPNSDYPDHKEHYIQLVRTWISEGAKDLNGNSPTLADALPEVEGVAAFDGSWLKRLDNQGSLKVNQTTTSLELYFAVTDDRARPQEMNGTIKFSTSKDEFGASEERTLEILTTPMLREGYWGEEVACYHKFLFNPQDFGQPGEQVFFRLYVSDNSHAEIEIPANGGAEEIKAYFSYTIND